MYHIYDLQKHVTHYRGAMLAKSFLKIIIILLLISIYMFPIALVFLYALARMKVKNNGTILFVKTFSWIFYLLGFVWIYNMVLKIRGGADEIKNVMELMLVFPAWYFWYKVNYPFLESLNNVVAYSKLKNHVLSTIGEKPSLKRTLLSVFCVSRFKAISTIRRFLQGLISLWANSYYFCARLFVIFSPVYIFYRARDYTSPYAESTKPFAQIEVTAGLLAQLIVVFFAPIISTFVLFSFGNFFRFISDSIARSNIEGYKALDKRKPIVFLRSFQNKNIILSRSKQSLMHKLFLVESRSRNLDNLLVDNYWHIGPVYALTNPAQKLLATGSIKQKLSSDDWQPAVLELMDDSIAVCIAVGSSKSLMWEIQQVSSRNLLHKCIFLFPPGQYIDNDLIKAFPGLEQLSNEEKYNVFCETTRAIIYYQGCPIIFKMEDSDPTAYQYILSYFFEEIQHNSVNPIQSFTDVKST